MLEVTPHRIEFGEVYYAVGLQYISDEVSLSNISPCNSLLISFQCHSATFEFPFEVQIIPCTSLINAINQNVTQHTVLTSICIEPNQTTKIKLVLTFSIEFYTTKTSFLKISSEVRLDYLLNHIGDYINPSEYPNESCSSLDLIYSATICTSILFAQENEVSFIGCISTETYTKDFQVWNRSECELVFCIEEASELISCGSNQQISSTTSLGKEFMWLSLKNEFFNIVLIDMNKSEVVLFHDTSTSSLLQSTQSSQIVKLAPFASLVFRCVLMFSHQDLRQQPTAFTIPLRFKNIHNPSNIVEYKIIVEMMVDDKSLTVLDDNELVQVQISEPRANSPADLIYESKLDRGSEEMLVQSGTSPQEVTSDADTPEVTDCIISEKLDYLSRDSSLPITNEPITHQYLEVIDVGNGVEDIPDSNRASVITVEDASPRDISLEIGPDPKLIKQISLHELDENEVKVDDPLNLFSESSLIETAKPSVDLEYQHYSLGIDMGKLQIGTSKTRGYELHNRSNRPLTVHFLTYFEPTNSSQLDIFPIEPVLKVCFTSQLPVDPVPGYVTLLHEVLSRDDLVDCTIPTSQVSPPSKNPKMDPNGFVFEEKNLPRKEIEDVSVKLESKPKGFQSEQLQRDSLMDNAGGQANPLTTKLEGLTSKFARLLEEKEKRLHARKCLDEKPSIVAIDPQKDFDSEKMIVWKISKKRIFPKEKLEKLDITNRDVRIEDLPAGQKLMVGDNMKMKENEILKQGKGLPLQKVNTNDSYHQLSSICSRMWGEDAYLSSLAIALSPIQSIPFKSRNFNAFNPTPQTSTIVQPNKKFGVKKFPPSVLSMLLVSTELNARPFTSQRTSLTAWNRYVSSTRPTLLEGRNQYAQLNQTKSNRIFDLMDSIHQSQTEPPVILDSRVSDHFQVTDNKISPTGSDPHKAKLVPLLSQCLHLGKESQQVTLLPNEKIHFFVVLSIPSANDTLFLKNLRNRSIFARHLKLNVIWVEMDEPARTFSHLKRNPINHEFKSIAASDDEQHESDSTRGIRQHDRVQLAGVKNLNEKDASKQPHNYLSAAYKMYGKMKGFNPFSKKKRRTTESSVNYHDSSRNRVSPSMNGNATEASKSSKWRSSKESGKNGVTSDSSDDERLRYQRKFGWNGQVQTKNGRISDAFESARIRSLLRSLSNYSSMTYNSSHLKEESRLGGTSNSALFVDLDKTDLQSVAHKRTIIDEAIHVNYSICVSTVATDQIRCEFGSCFVGQWKSRELRLINDGEVPAVVYAYVLNADNTLESMVLPDLNQYPERDVVTCSKDSVTIQPHTTSVLTIHHFASEAGFELKRTLLLINIHNPSNMLKISITRDRAIDFKQQLLHSLFYKIIQHQTVAKNVPDRISQDQSSRNSIREVGYDMSDNPLGFEKCLHGVPNTKIFRIKNIHHKNLIFDILLKKDSMLKLFTIRSHRDLHRGNKSTKEAVDTVEHDEANRKEVTDPLLNFNVTVDGPLPSRKDAPNLQPADVLQIPPVNHSLLIEAIRKQQEGLFPFFVSDNLTKTAKKKDDVPTQLIGNTSPENVCGIRSRFSSMDNFPEINDTTATQIGAVELKSSRKRNVQLSISTEYEKQNHSVQEITKDVDNVESSKRAIFDQSFPSYVATSKSSRSMIGVDDEYVLAKREKLPQRKTSIDGVQMNENRLTAMKVGTDDEIAINVKKIATYYKELNKLLTWNAKQKTIKPDDQIEEYLIPLNKTGSNSEDVLSVEVSPGKSSTFVLFLMQEVSKQSDASSGEVTQRSFDLDEHLQIRTDGVEAIDVLHSLESNENVKLAYLHNHQVENTTVGVDNLTASGSQPFRNNEFNGQELMKIFHRPRKIRITTTEWVVSEITAIQKTLNFGKLSVGDEKSRELTIANNSKLPSMYSIGMSGSISSTYLEIIGRWGYIEPMSSKQISLSFKPALSGSFEETVRIINVLNPSNDNQVLVKALVFKPESFTIEACQSEQPFLNDPNIQEIRNRITTISDGKQSSGKEGDIHQTPLLLPIQCVLVSGKEAVPVIRFRIQNISKKSRQFEIHFHQQDLVQANAVLHEQTEPATFNDLFNLRQNEDDPSNLYKLIDLHCHFQAMVDDKDSKLSSDVAPIRKRIEALKDVDGNDLKRNAKLSIDDTAKLEDQLEFFQQKLKIAIRKNKVEKIGKIERKIHGVHEALFENVPPFNEGQLSKYVNNDTVRFSEIVTEAVEVVEAQEVERTTKSDVKDEFEREKASEIEQENVSESGKQEFQIDSIQTSVKILEPNTSQLGSLQVTDNHCIFRLAAQEEMMITTTVHFNRSLQNYRDGGELIPYVGFFRVSELRNQDLIKKVPFLLLISSQASVPEKRNSEVVVDQKQVESIDVNIKDSMIGYQSSIRPAEQTLLNHDKMIGKDVSPIVGQFKQINPLDIKVSCSYVPKWCVPVVLRNEFPSDTTHGKFTTEIQLTPLPSKVDDCYVYASVALIIHLAVDNLHRPLTTLDHSIWIQLTSVFEDSVLDLNQFISIAVVRYENIQLVEDSKCLDQLVWQDPSVDQKYEIPLIFLNSIHMIENSICDQSIPLKLWIKYKNSSPSFEVTTSHRTWMLLILSSCNSPSPPIPEEKICIYSTPNYTISSQSIMNIDRVTIVSDEKNPISVGESRSSYFWLRNLSEDEVLEYDIFFEDETPYFSACKRHTTINETSLESNWPELGKIVLHYDRIQCRIPPLQSKKVAFTIYPSKEGLFQTKLWIRNQLNLSDNKNVTLHTYVTAARGDYILFPELELLPSTGENGEIVTEAVPASRRKYKPFNFGTILVQDQASAGSSGMMIDSKPEFCMVPTISELDKDSRSRLLEIPYKVIDPMVFRMNNISNQSVFVSAYPNLKSQCLVYSDSSLTKVAEKVEILPKTSMILYICLRPTTVSSQSKGAGGGALVEKSKTASMNKLKGQSSVEEDSARELIGGIRFVYSLIKSAATDPAKNEEGIYLSSMAEKKSIADDKDLRRLFEITVQFRAMIVRTSFHTSYCFSNPLKQEDNRIEMTSLKEEENRIIVVQSLLGERSVSSPIQYATGSVQIRNTSNQSSLNYCYGIKRTGRENCLFCYPTFKSNLIDESTSDERFRSAISYFSRLERNSTGQFKIIIIDDCKGQLMPNEKKTVACVILRMNGGSNPNYGLFSSHEISIINLDTKECNVLPLYVFARPSNSPYDRIKAIDYEYNQYRDCLRIDLSQPISVFWVNPSGADVIKEQSSQQNRVKNEPSITVFDEAKSSKRLGEITDKKKQSRHFFVSVSQSFEIKSWTIVNSSTDGSNLILTPMSDLPVWICIEILSESESQLSSFQQKKPYSRTKRNKNAICQSWKRELQPCGTTVSIPPNAKCKVFITFVTGQPLSPHLISEITESKLTSGSLCFCEGMICLCRGSYFLQSIFTNPRVDSKKVDKIEERNTHLSKYTDQGLPVYDVVQLELSLVVPTLKSDNTTLRMKSFDGENAVRFGYQSGTEELVVENSSCVDIPFLVDNLPSWLTILNPSNSHESNNSSALDLANLDDATEIVEGHPELENIKRPMMKQKQSVNAMSHGDHDSVTSENGSDNKSIHESLHIKNENHPREVYQGESKPRMTNPTVRLMRTFRGVVVKSSKLIFKMVATAPFIDSQELVHTIKLINLLTYRCNVAAELIPLQCHRNGALEVSNLIETEKLDYSMTALEKRISQYFKKLGCNVTDVRNESFDINVQLEVESRKALTLHTAGKEMEVDLQSILTTHHRKLPYQVKNARLQYGDKPYPYCIAVTQCPGDDAVDFVEIDQWDRCELTRNAASDVTSFVDRLFTCNGCPYHLLLPKVVLNTSEEIHPSDQIRTFTHDIANTSLADSQMIRYSKQAQFYFVYLNGLNTPWIIPTIPKSCSIGTNNQVAESTTLDLVNESNNASEKMRKSFIIHNNLKGNIRVTASFKVNASLQHVVDVQVMLGMKTIQSAKPHITKRESTEDRDDPSLLPEQAETATYIDLLTEESIELRISLKLKPEARFHCIPEPFETNDQATTTMSIPNTKSNPSYQTEPDNETFHPTALSICTVKISPIIYHTSPQTDLEEKDSTLATGETHAIHDDIYIELGGSILPGPTCFVLNASDFPSWPLSADGATEDIENIQGSRDDNIGYHDVGRTINLLPGVEAQHNRQSIWLSHGLRRRSNDDERHSPITFPLTLRPDKETKISELFRNLFPILQVEKQHQYFYICNPSTSISIEVLISSTSQEDSSQKKIRNEDSFVQAIRRPGVRFVCDQTQDGFDGSMRDAYFDTVALHAFPKRVVIPPGKCQLVRLTLQPGDASKALTLSKPEIPIKFNPITNPKLRTSEKKTGLIMAFPLQIVDLNCLHHPPLHVAAFLTRDGLEDCLPSLPTMPVSKTDRSKHHLDTVVSTSTNKAVDSSSMVTKEKTEESLKLRIRGATPTGSCKGRYNIDFGQQPARIEALEWLITMENISSSGTIMYGIRFTKEWNDSRWIVINQPEGSIHAKSSHSIILYFDRRTPGLYQSYLLIENQLNLEDSQIINVTMKVVSPNHSVTSLQKPLLLTNETALSTGDRVESHDNSHQAAQPKSLLSMESELLSNFAKKVEMNPTNDQVMAVRVIKANELDGNSQTNLQFFSVVASSYIEVENKLAVAIRCNVLWKHERDLLTNVSELSVLTDTSLLRLIITVTSDSDSPIPLGMLSMGGPDSVHIELDPNESLLLSCRIEITDPTPNASRVEAVANNQIILSQLHFQCSLFEEHNCCIPIPIDWLTNSAQISLK